MPDKDMPKTRVAAKLPSRAADTGRNTSRDSDDESSMMRVCGIGNLQREPHKNHFVTISGKQINYPKLGC